MTEKNSHRRGFSSTVDREEKALKIKAVLREFAVQLPSNIALLDIGTGNGEIAYHLGKAFQITSVDVEDKRAFKQNFNFLLCNESLPFPAETFDIVVSNHVIEHVNKQKMHVDEIFRVLKAHGIAYLATPNRVWPWEVHYKLPVLHYLSQNFYTWFLKKSGVYKEDIKLLTWNKLRNLLTNKVRWCERRARSHHLNRLLDKPGGRRAGFI